MVPAAHTRPRPFCRPAISKLLRHGNAREAQLGASPGRLVARQVIGPDEVGQQRRFVDLRNEAGAIDDIVGRQIEALLEFLLARRAA